MGSAQNDLRKFSKNVLHNMPIGVQGNLALQLHQINIHQKTTNYRDEL